MQESNVANILAGATPGTFDGDIDISVSGDAVKALWLALAHTLSAWTTDEGGGMVLRAKSKSFPEVEFVDRSVWHSGPATNSSTKGMEPTLIPVDLKLSGGGTVTINLTSFGITQTGTINATIGVLYQSRGAVPPDILSGLPVHAVDGGALWDLVSGTARQLLDAVKSGVLEFPSGLKEICGMTVLCAKDAAVTAAKPAYGNVEVKSTTHSIGEQFYPFPAMLPGIGTEVEGGVPSRGIYYPMHIPLMGKASKFQIYANMAEAVTGGVQILAALHAR